jgi:hypothetical protein
MDEKIAKFIGVDAEYSPTIYKDSKSPLRHILNNRNKSEGLLFDSDWNWLMVVVEKIESLGYDENEFDIFGNCVQLGNEEFVGKSKIEATYKAVCWWISENTKKTAE